uniref:Palmitoyltransferase n=1 Tax=Aureoumbra lagunensis TaxID=44058 RepID=A0A7S3K675_9STRA|mmetsp:Transcript_16584/g.24916  ORF Transcript_16584/g.24916 Transcript_16584/m.24916 type:complete len:268 (+) Transcript_16584:46-849(+)
MQLELVRQKNDLDETKRSELSEVSSVISSIDEEVALPQAAIKDSGKDRIEFATSQWRDQFDDDFCDLCNPRFAKRLLLRFGFSRQRFIGNMLVIAFDNDGIPILMAGPYWTMLLFITIPLCIIGPLLICIYWCARLHLAIQILYGLIVFLVALGLLSTALRNPGILRRHLIKPSCESALHRQYGAWQWNDQTRTFKPKSARFDPWCDCVILDFDHTCPWTGTAIGKNNIRSFRFFVTALQFLAYATAAVFIIAAVGAAKRSGNGGPR